jgi:hypothetical protein
MSERLWIALGKIEYQTKVELPPQKCLCLVYKFEVLCSMFIDFFGGGQLNLHEKSCAYHLNFFFTKNE